jgi:hypothetical protein
LYQITEFHTNSSAIDILLDEIIRLCADCDEPLATRLETILGRASSPLEIGRGLHQPARSVATALRMLVYVSQERGAEAAVHLERIDACIHELVAWCCNQQQLVVASAACSIKATHLLS